LKNDGQENEMKLKPELSRIAAQYGEKAGGYKSTWEEIKTLGQSYGTGAVSHDFEEWMIENQGDDFPQGAVPAYLRYASDRLSSDSPAQQALARGSEVVSLTRELTSLSEGEICFSDKHRVRLSEVQKEFGTEEVISVYREWLGKQDLSDPKNVSFLPGKFVQIADSLCYSSKKRREEKAKEKIAREAAVEKLQAAAEEERRKLAEKKKAEDIDPLGLFS
jgi:hypothetical protein